MQDTSEKIRKERKESDDGMSVFECLFECLHPKTPLEVKKTKASGINQHPWTSSDDDDVSLHPYFRFTRLTYTSCFSSRPVLVLQAMSHYMQVDPSNLLHLPLTAKSPFPSKSTLEKES